jgi:hypothetical protein
VSAGARGNGSHRAVQMLTAKVRNRALIAVLYRSGLLSVTRVRHVSVMFVRHEAHGRKNERTSGTTGRPKRSGALRAVRGGGGEQLRRSVRDAIALRPAAPFGADQTAQ